VNIFCKIVFNENKSHHNIVRKQGAKLYTVKNKERTTSSYMQRLPKNCTFPYIKGNLSSYMNLHLTDCQLYEKDVPKFF
jgi:hypothetical protein